MISLFFVILASVFFAVIDTLSHHYGRSWFARFDPYFWNPDISWENKYSDYPTPKFWGSTNIFVWTTDAFHLFKSMGIICFMASIIVYREIYGPIIDLIIHGATYNIVFSLFYHVILIKKT